MKRITPLSLTIQNFKSVGEETTIDFTTLSSLTLIKGINNDIKSNNEKLLANNGSGKSTIIDAILFSLYGKTLRNINNAKIINRTIGNKLKTFVRFKFKLDDDVYISEANFKSSGKNPSIGFLLQKNDEPALDRNTPQMKDLIENQILGCPYDLFKSSIVISQSSYQNFYEMTKSEKVNYIEQLFKLTDFGLVLKMVRADMNAAKMEYNTSNINLSKIGERLFDLNNKNNRFVTENSGKTDAIKTAITLKQKAIKSCESEALKYVAIKDRSKKEQELKDLRDTYESKRNQLLKFNSAISTLKGRIDSASGVLDKHSEVLDIICKDCYSKVDEILDLTSMKNLIIDDNKKSEVITEAITKTNTECIEIQKQITAVSQEIEEIRNQERQRMLNDNQITYLRKELEGLENQLRESTEQENPFSDLIIKAKTELDDANSVMKLKSIEIKRLQLLELASSDAGAKKDLLTDLALLINDLMKHYLTQLGANYSVIFDAGFDFEFITPTGACDIDSFSSGERQRISLATMFSFRDLITGNRIFSDLCILDECIDSGIDQFGIERIVDSIYQMSLKDNIKFAIVSHNKAVSDKFESYREDGNNISILTAIKTDGQTTYEVA
ncbi:MAG: AAA family ATPase [Bacilli bacterium]